MDKKLHIPQGCTKKENHSGTIPMPVMGEEQEGDFTWFPVITAVFPESRDFYHRKSQEPVFWKSQGAAGGRGRTGGKVKMLHRIQPNVPSTLNYILHKTQSCNVIYILYFQTNTSYQKHQLKSKMCMTVLTYSNRNKVGLQQKKVMTVGVPLSDLWLIH